MSSPPSSGTMKPKPLSTENHLTLPVQTSPASPPSVESITRATRRARTGARAAARRSALSGVATTVENGAERATVSFATAGRIRRWAA